MEVTKAIRDKAMTVKISQEKKKQLGIYDDFTCSSTKIDCFRACPMRYCLKYEQDVHPIEDSDALRTGTNWHKLHELAASVSADEVMDTINEELSRAYDTSLMPSWKTVTEWQVEKYILFYSFMAHQWYYKESEYTTVATELSFKEPILGTNIITKGRMDSLKDKGNIKLVGEIKSTSHSVEPDSDFWKSLRMALQPSFYVHAARAMQKKGLILDDKQISGVLYDVWHKPSISPKKLTQKDSAEFMETKMYFNQKFDVKIFPDGKSLCTLEIDIDGVGTELEPGKKEGTFAIKETPEMFGVRLFADIIERPHFYFAQHEIPRTSADMNRFTRDVTNICHTIEHMRETNSWFHNEKQCEATFKCSYINICYNNIDVSKGELPEGYEHKFTNKEKK